MHYSLCEPVNYLNLYDLLFFSSGIPLFLQKRIDAITKYTTEVSAILVYCYVRSYIFTGGKNRRRYQSLKQGSHLAESCGELARAYGKLFYH